MSRIELHRRQVQRGMVIIDEYLSKDPLTVPRMEDLARASGASQYHFHRIFLAQTGESPHEYFNARRLQIALSSLLSNKEQKLIDLALWLGYESHASFTTAFSKRFGLAPRQAVLDLDAAARLIEAPKKLVRTKKIEIEHDVSNERAFNFYYRSQRGVTDGQFFAHENVVQQIGDFLNANGNEVLVPTGAFPKSPQGMNDQMVDGHFGAFSFADIDQNWSEQVQRFEEGRWLKFPHIGEFQYLHQTWNRAYQFVLSHSGFELRDEWPIEVYFQSPKNYQPTEKSAEVWLPIK
ncbi:AraC family transcriptional regulator [Maritalea sp.]|uniref:AraC family transcriptional regulator n=1 Tax=Maritalea sp. TaxID=2003361 RepID=UPI003EF565FC